MVAVSGEGAWQVTTPLLPRTFTGAGDLLNYLQHDLRGRRAVLADINKARMKALRSHADPEWMTIHPGSSLEDLWVGR